MNFYKIFACSADFNSKLQQNAVFSYMLAYQYNLRIKFSTLNVDFSSSSPDPLGSRRSVQAGVKDGYSSKNGYFTAVGSCRMKTFADRQRHAAYHNKQ